PKICVETLAVQFAPHRLSHSSENRCKLRNIGEMMMLKQILSITIVFGLSFGLTGSRNISVLADKDNAVTVHSTDTMIGNGDDIVISGHDLRRTLDCNGKNVLVEANDSTIVLRGNCNELEVDGCCNTITVDVVDHIILNSADNTVRWKKAANG